jgi:hypothetical protein
MIILVAIILIIISIFLLARTIRILRNFNSKSENSLDQLIEFLFMVVFPILGIAITNTPCDNHPFHVDGILTTYTVTIIFALAFYISKYYKHKLSPFLLLVISSLMLFGILFCTVTCFHFLPFFIILVVPLYQFLYLSPLLCILYLLRELNTLSGFLKDAFKEKNNLQNSDPLNPFYKLLEKYNLGFALYILAPITACIQAGLYLFGQKPDSLISQFTDSCGFLLSNQHYCSCGGDHYLCSIAANGNKELVKPVRLGLRQNEKILVNRQLLIANAFENWLEEHTPRLHKSIRSTYDNMNIPVNSWSKRKKFANTLYVFMKPLEWLFLAWLYVFDKDPETRIAKQYLPKKDLEQFIKQHTYETNL